MKILRSPEMKTYRENMAKYAPNVDITGFIAINYYHAGLLQFEVMRQGARALAVLDEIVSLRKEIADLYGVPSFAHYVTKRRMVESPEKVTSFLDDVRNVVTEAEIRDLGHLADRDRNAVPYSDHGASDIFNRTRPPPPPPVPGPPTTATAGWPRRQWCSTTARRAWAARSSCRPASPS